MQKIFSLFIEKVYAQDADGSSGFSIPKPLGDVSLQKIVASLIDAAFLVAGIVAVIYLIIGGYQYITSAGNPEQVGTAKNTILYSIVGLIVILLSALIVKYILGALGIREGFDIGIS